MEAELKRIGLPDRAAAPLVNAALGERVRNAAYRNHAGVTMPVASRDMAALVTAGLLNKAGDKRGTTYTAGAKLESIAAKYPRAPQPDDPFTAQ